MFVTDLALLVLIFILWFPDWWDRLHERNYCRLEERDYEFWNLYKDEDKREVCQFQTDGVSIPVFLAPKELAYAKLLKAGPYAVACTPEGILISEEFLTLNAVIQRFVYMHEAGHFLAGHPGKRPPKEDPLKFEKVAERFAAERVGIWAGGLTLICMDWWLITRVFIKIPRHIPHILRNTLIRFLAMVR